MMKKMTEDITTSIQTSMASFSHNIEEKLGKLSEDVISIQSRLNTLEASSSTNVTPSVNIEHIDAIKNIMTQGVDRMSAELRSESLRISKLEDCRRFEDEYAANLGTLRGEFGRMRGAADNFTKLQADALKELREDSKHLTSSSIQCFPICTRRGQTCFPHRLGSHWLGQELIILFRPHSRPSLTQSPTPLHTFWNLLHG